MLVDARLLATHRTGEVEPAAEGEDLFLAVIRLVEDQPTAVDDRNVRRALHDLLLWTEAAPLKIVVDAVAPLVLQAARGSEGREGEEVVLPAQVRRHVLQEIVAVPLND